MNLYDYEQHEHKKMLDNYHAQKLLRTEKPNMNQTPAQEKIVDPSTGLDSKRIDLKQPEYVDKSRYFSIKNWRTIEKETSLGYIVDWKADVLKYGDSLQLLTVVDAQKPKEISESATAFRTKINKLLDGKNPQNEFFLRIKYGGKKNNKHDFDVEFA